MDGKLSLTGIIVLILGGIGSFVAAFFGGRTAEVYGGYFSSHVSYERNWWITIGIFLGCLFCTWILFLILYGMSDIISNQQEILGKIKTIQDNEQNTSYLLQNTSTDNQVLTKVIPTKIKDGEWICKCCGRTNASYVGTCGCGKMKD